jgi:hypothetical protein
MTDPRRKANRIKADIRNRVKKKLEVVIITRQGKEDGGGVPPPAPQVASADPVAVSSRGNDHAALV